MQDLLSTLATPVVIGLIVLVLVALAIVVLLARRRRSSQEPPPDLDASLGGPVDYTSLPLDEEPSGWRERFARLSLAGKILAVLVPILAVLGLVALILALLPSGQPTAPVATVVPVTIKIRDAAVIKADPLTIDISAETTGLSDGTTVIAELLEDGAAFPFLNADQARGTVRRNRVEIQALRANDAPTPTEGRTYTVIIRGPGDAVSAAAPLLVPEINRIAATFFGRAAPTPTARPTTAPTAAAGATTAPTVEPTAVPTVEVSLPTGPAAEVINGGNVRQLPIRTSDNVVAGINAGEQVQLLGRTPNGQWYRVRTVRNELGWVSVTLLRVPADASVPVAPIVTVFVNGALYERPDPASTELDRVNIDEVVLLKQKTADGAWYEVNNVRNISGWVPARLLGIPDEVAQNVPVTP